MAQSIDGYGLTTDHLNKGGRLALQAAMTQRLLDVVAKLEAGNLSQEERDEIYRALGSGKQLSDAAQEILGKLKPKA